MDKRAFIVLSNLYYADKRLGMGPLAFACKGVRRSEIGNCLTWLMQRGYVFAVVYHGCFSYGVSQEGKDIYLEMLGGGVKSEQCNE